MEVRHSAAGAAGLSRMAQSKLRLHFMIMKGHERRLRAAPLLTLVRRGAAETGGIRRYYGKVRCFKMPTAGVMWTQVFSKRVAGERRGG